MMVRGRAYQALSSVCQRLVAVGLRARRQRRGPALLADTAQSVASTTCSSQLLPIAFTLPKGDKERPFLIVTLSPALHTTADILTPLPFHTTPDNQSSSFTCTSSSKCSATAAVSFPSALLASSPAAPAPAPAFASVPSPTSGTPAVLAALPVASKKVGGNCPNLSRSRCVIWGGSSHHLHSTTHTWCQ